MRPRPNVLVASIADDMVRSKRDLVAENALLRQQLIILQHHDKRPQLTGLLCQVEVLSIVKRYFFELGRSGRVVAVMNP